MAQDKYFLFEISKDRKGMVGGFASLEAAVGYVAAVADSGNFQHEERIYEVFSSGRTVIKLACGGRP